MANNEWEDLTNDEILDIISSSIDFQGRISLTWVNQKNNTALTNVAMHLYRDISRKLKEKNNE